MHKGMISPEQRSPQGITPRQHKQAGRSARWSRLVIRISVVAVVLISVSLFSLVGNKNLPSAYALANGQEMTPVMGWSSWNAYFANINASVIERAADAVVSSGMKAAGYQYVNTDEGWWSGSRDGSGNITVNQSKWPGGMQALASYIHSKGLKAGIYTDAGKDGCGGATQESYGHYDQDMQQFEKWDSIRRRSMHRSATLLRRQLHRQVILWGLVFANEECQIPGTGDRVLEFLARLERY